MSRQVRRETFWLSLPEATSHAIQDVAQARQMKVDDLIARILDSWLKVRDRTVERQP